uniref:Hexon protein n=6 Tax=unclassified Aviadenovirus TaxID=280050 RepID=A0A7T4S043_9ADEN|nr:hexon [Pacific black duck aviadenovirus]
MAAMTPDLTTATPRLSYFHIAGPGTREYLSEDLQQFMSATSSYFELRNKFRQTISAPTRNVTTEKAQRLQIRYYPIQSDDTSNTHRVRFSINVGDSWVLDMGTTYFDIKGTLDRGPSFKPYSGTAYNPLAPKESVFNFWYSPATNPGKNFVGAQLSSFYMNSNSSSETDTKAELDKMNSVYPDPNFGTGLSIPELVIDKTEIEKVSGLSKIAKTNIMLAHGAYVKPIAESGSQTISDTKYILTKDYVKYQGAVSVEDYTDSLVYPDSLYIPPSSDPDYNFGITRGLRANYIGFRDNFINLLYHDSGVCSGTLNSERSGMNVVVALQDRNTELSYQYMLADMMSRHHYFALWNQAVDQYDHDVRVINNDGYEDVNTAYSFAPVGIGNQVGGDLYTDLKMVSANTNGTMNTSTGKVDDLKIAVGTGNIPAYEINITASLKRNFLVSNVAEYLPDKYKYDADESTSSFNINSYKYMNRRIPLTNIVDLFTNIGARWSIDQMDNVNPFNHHRNWGLKYRSQLLGNSRYCNFHIQVPQKYFAIKNLLLLPGTYTYEWVLRKDPNMILQSSLGNDLRLDGASITFTEINLMASFMPMDHNTSNQLELMMRNATNDQTFMDYLGAKNALYSIPANSTQITINIPARTWEGMRGWSFTRLKTKETPQQGAQYDVGFNYSGSIPYLDGTFYLNHTFRNMSVLFDTSINWPGNDRLMSPNMFEIKRNTKSDSEGFTMSQSDITKDWWLIQMATNYNYVYNGYRFWPDRNYFHYDFLRNFDPMSKQDPDFTQADIHNLVSMNSGNLNDQEIIRNNSGFIAPRSQPVSNGRQGHAWPANWPYPMIGENSIEKSKIVNSKKFLCDNYLWTIPFSSDFMYMGELTDLGQNPMYTNNSHSMVINFEVDPMDEDTYLYMLYGVFDAVRVNQPERNVLAMAYFRTPFATGNAV